MVIRNFRNGSSGKAFALKPRGRSLTKKYYSTLYYMKLYYMLLHYTTQNCTTLHET